MELNFLKLKITSLQTPPVWFSESEDSKVSDALSHLAATQGLDNHLLYQVELLSNISTNNPSQHTLYPPLNIPIWSKQRSCKDLELKYDGPGEAACETPLHNILPARYWTLCIIMFSQVLTLFFFLPCFLSAKRS